MIGSVKGTGMVKPIDFGVNVCVICILFRSCSLPFSPFISLSLFLCHPYSLALSRWVFPPRVCCLYLFLGLSCFLCFPVSVSISVFVFLHDVYLYIFSCLYEYVIYSARKHASYSIIRWNTNCNTLQQAATHYNTLQHATTDTPQQAATHCNTLQYTLLQCFRACVLCLCVCKCIYIYVYVYTYIHMYVYIRIYVWMYVYTCIHVQTYCICQYTITTYVPSTKGFLVVWGVDPCIYGIYVWYIHVFHTYVKFVLICRCASICKSDLATQDHRWCGLRGSLHTSNASHAYIECILYVHIYTQVHIWHCIHT